MTSAKAASKRPPNTKLRAAREALGGSGTTRVSRARLARKLEAQAHKMKINIGFDPTKIQRWEEKGMLPQEPALDVLLAFFAQYGYTAASLGFESEPVHTSAPIQAAAKTEPSVVPIQVNAQEDDVKRRQLTAGAAALAGLPVLESFTSPAAPRIPHQVGRHQVEQVRRHSAVVAALDEGQGGRFVNATVIAELEWASRLLTEPCPPTVRRDLFAAVAELAAVAGFAMFDAYEHGNARKAFRFGVACAEEIGHWSLRAKLLCSMGRQANWLGDPDQGLTFIEIAQARSDRLTHTERAALSTVRARALAQLGRREETLRSIGAADEAVSRSEPSKDARWMAYYDRAQHLGETGQALADLAASTPEVLARARERLSAASACHTDKYARARVLSEIRLASVIMASPLGDPSEAANIGNGILGAVEEMQSPRVLDFARELESHARKRNGSLDAATLSDRIRMMSA